MTEFLYVETRTFHPDYDTPAARQSFRIQWDVAGRRALAEPARALLDIVLEVGAMHRAWNGPWCIPSKGSTVGDAPVFVVDEANRLYRCCVCGTAWHLEIPSTEAR